MTAHTCFALKGLAVLMVLFGSATQAVACTPTGFVQDSMILTAALINPAGSVSGDVDATGCNIGIYYAPGASGHVNGASVHGANYYGIVNNGGNVPIQDSTVYDIGETPLNGAQHGVAIYFALESNAQGNIHGNVVWNYQKAGIVVNGPLAISNVQNNTVIGQGPINYIAQNGIQLGFGAQGNIQNNIVVGHSYTGANFASSGGIVLVGGDCYGGPTQNGSNVHQNTVVGNDVGVWFSNLESDCITPVATPTEDLATQNTVRNNAVNNISGGGPGVGYQAGISDKGDDDTIRGNSICGIGYTPVAVPPPYLFFIDLTYTNDVTVKNNTTCNATVPITPDVLTSAANSSALSATVRPSVIK
jgi:hypothetical protein